ncbi:MAG: LacI family DNA-binding transcriptional regulator [Lentisphaeria bacterium]
MVKQKFSDPAYSYLIDGISTEINKHHYHMILAKLSGTEETMYDLPPILRDERVDGIILSGSFDSNIVKIIKSLKIQCVVIGNYDTHLLNSLNNVRFNYQLSLLNVINTLVAQGKKRIAFVDEMRDNFLVQEMFNYYKLALKENNLPFNKEICYFGQGPFSGIYQTLQPVFDSNTLPFDAIVSPTLRLAQEISNLTMVHFGFNQKIDIIIATYRPSDYYKLPVPTIYIENSYATIAPIAIKLLLEQIQQKAGSQTIMIN